MHDRHVAGLNVVDPLALIPAPAVSGARRPAVLLVVTGTLGDVAPMAAVAHRLAGSCDITVMTSCEYFSLFSDRIERQPTLRALTSSAESVLMSPAGVRAIEGGFGGLRRMAGFHALVRDELTRFQFDVANLLGQQQWSLVVTAGPTIGVEQMATERGIPVRRVQYQPTWPSPEQQSMYWSRRPTNSDAARRISRSLAERGSQRLFRAALRGQQLSTRPRLDESLHLGLPTWFALPSLLATHAIAESPIGLTVGFVRPHLPEPSNLLLATADRLSMRRSRRPRVFIGFGSMRTPYAHRLTDHFVSAALSIGAEPLVQKGDGGTPTPAALDSQCRSEEVLLVPPGDHRYVFPHVDLVVCHGGIGTCVAALDAGVPMVIVPQWLDQFYWAQQFEQLGLAKAGYRVHSPTRARDLIIAALQIDTASPAAEELRASDGLDMIAAGASGMIQGVATP